MNLNNSPLNKGISNFTIIKILKKFTLKEISEFDKFINSPFYNNHSTVIKLFRELKNYYPEFTDNILTKEFLFEVINPGKKYDDSLFQKYLSRINKLAEEYLGIIESRNDHYKKEIKILYQLSKRDLREIYSRKLKEFEKEMELNFKLDEFYYLIKHNLSEVKYYHKSRGNNVTTSNVDILDSYNNLINYFFAFSSSCLGQILSDKYSYNYANLLNSSGIFFDRKEMGGIVSEFLENTPLSDKKRILFLKLIENDLKMNSVENGFEAYKELRKIVIENTDVLSNIFLLYFLKRLNVFCIIENANGINNMNKDLFENYKLILKKKLFILEDVPDLRLNDYRMILSSAFKTNEIEWAENFINESVNLIKEESRENVVNYGYAVLMFHKKNYSGSLDHIAMIKNEMLTITIDIYVLKIKLFYELGFFDTVMSVADTFRHYLTNNKIISRYLKESLSSFLKFLRILISLKKKPSKQKQENLMHELESSSRTWNRSWLIEKLK